MAEKRNIFDSALSESNRNAADKGLYLGVDGFSPRVQEIITAITDTYQCDRNAVILSMLVAGGVAMGKQIRIFDGKYWNSPILFGVIVAPSGSNKSRPMAEVVSPLRHRDAQTYETYRTELDAWKSIKKNTDPRPVWCEQMLLSDATPEAINAALFHQRNGMLLKSDEICNFINNLDRYHKGAGATFLLSLFDGDNITVNRKTDDTLLISNPFLSILGSCQPSVLNSVFSEQMIRAGLPQRFLFTYQSEQMVTPYNDKTLSDEVRDSWAELIANIYNKSQSVLYLRGDANLIRIPYINDLRSLKVGTDDYTAAIFSKMEILVNRLAGIVHALNENDTAEITPSEMLFACDMARYFQRTAQLVANDLKGDTQPLNKAELIKQIWLNFNCISQSALASALGISHQYINKILNGK